MGNRGVIKFNGYGQDIAAIYLHNSGSYADEVLDQFFTDEINKHITRQSDNRFDDPSYLAARFVAWYSDPNGLGVGITTLDHNEDTNWRVWCEDSNKPRVERL